MKKRVNTTYILHGWTQDLSKWQPFVRKLKKAGIPAVLLPIPGLSSKLDKPWILDDYVNWLNRQLGTARNVNIIAHSFGGRIAIRFDVKNPNIIKRLVLIDSSGIRPSSLPAVLKRVSFHAMAKIGKKITSHKKAREFLYRLAGESDYFKADQILAQTMANIVKIDQRTDLPFVKAPTLIIWGSQDKITPLSDGRLMNKNITGSTLKIINEAKHSPHYTHPTEVVPIISGFLKNK